MDILERIYCVRPENTDYYFFMGEPRRTTIYREHQQAQGREPVSLRSSMAALHCSPGLMSRSQTIKINIHRDDEAQSNNSQVAVLNY